MVSPVACRNSSRIFRGLVLAGAAICILSGTSGSCQTQLAVGKRQQRLMLPLTKFYDPPQPLASGKAGELIRSEVYDEYYLPVDFSATRILYRSVSAAGEVAVSGVVLAPDRTPPSGGWPVIAWAHGFTGAARQCAPSLRRNLYYGPLLSMYLNLGYAVVASDYAGLGASSRSAVFDVQAHAADVIYAMPAARAAVPQLSRKWIAMGSSLGANVAIAVAEMEATSRDSGYLGSIAISPIPEMQTYYVQPAQESAGMLVALAYGIKTAYPEFHVEDMLTGKALPAYRAIDESCSGSELPASSVLKQSWTSNRFVREFFSRNAVGRKPAYGPLLIISDDQDAAIPASQTTQLIARMCKQGDRVQQNKVSDASDLIVGDSVREQMSWMEARFSGRAAPTDCR